MNTPEIREATGIYGATRVAPQFGGSAVPVLAVEGPFRDPVKASCSKRIRPVGGPLAPRRDHQKGEWRHISGEQIRREPLSLAPGRYRCEAARC